MMARLGKWLPSTLALAGFILLASPQSARAILMLESTQASFDFTGTGVHSILFVDENALGAPGSVISFLGRSVLLGNDSNPGVVGSLVIAGPGGAGTSLQVGAFLVQGSASQSNSPGTTGSPTVETLTSTSLTVTNNSGATASQQVAVSDINFSPLLGGTMFSTAGGTIIGAGSVTVTTVDNGSNQQFAGTSVNPGAPGPNQFGFNGTVFTGNYNASDTKAIPFTSTMSKNMEFDVSLANNSVLSGRLNQITNTGIAVPEPGSMAMVVAGLGTLAFGYKFRRPRWQA